jgi:hypothetical protein
VDNKGFNDSTTNVNFVNNDEKQDIENGNASICTIVTLQFNIELGNAFKI